MHPLILTLFTGLKMNNVDKVKGFSVWLSH